MRDALPIFSDREIFVARPAKNAVDPHRPYAFHVEAECTADARVVDVATIFLTNRECPFRCLMCDLWMNTTDTCVPDGAIPSQIDFALSRLPSAQHVKLYNNGNFFDVQAIPPVDYRAIVERVNSFKNIIVENHPKLCTDRCLQFRDLLETHLEIAIGLETVHQDVLNRLNKQMTLDDFQRAVDFLLIHDIAVRAFILHKPPFMDEQQGIEWSLRSIEWAFSIGVGCCTVIPTRSGKGLLERLQHHGLFSPPTLASVEQVLEEGLRISGGRVLMDLWDIEHLYNCPDCGPQRTDRMRRMNLSQHILPTVRCDCNS